VSQSAELGGFGAKGGKEGGKNWSRSFGRKKEFGGEVREGWFFEGKN